MTDTLNFYPDVIRGNFADAEFIVEWLKVEWDDEGGWFGFWGNRNMIRNGAAADGDLWVIRHNGEAVAFQLGDHSADIIAVHRDHRGGGHGTMLTEAANARAMRDNVPVLDVQCSPETSLGFWQKMGFEQYVDRRRPDEIRARKVLPRFFDLSNSAPRAQVSIGFYPESAQYYGLEGQVPALAVHNVLGAPREDGSIQLERRVVGLAGDEPEDKDLTVRIEVNGRKVYFGKAKYEDAASAGIVNVLRHGAFYIDAVRLNSAAQSAR